MLADDLAAALESTPGLSATELAAQVGAACERDVSLALFAGHRRFRMEKGDPPRWSLAAGASVGLRRGPPARPAASSVPNSPPTAPKPATPSAAPAVALGLYAWQADALAAWERAGRRGVIEAVTGSGKTMVGVAATLAELSRRRQVLVLVPTVELARQWVTTLTPRLPGGTSVGQMGAGTGDTLATHDVLVAVVNSARAGDVRPIRPCGLLVADECHRYAGAVNRLALDGRFEHRLGLSATYARDDGGHLAWLDPYFGGTCFRLGYARAVSENVTARFTVTLVGCRLSPSERACYDELTEELRKLWGRLVGRHGLPAQPFAAFLAAVAEAAEGDGDAACTARAYRRSVLERRRLLADTPAKDAAIVALAPAVADADRTIVFTQSIEASERMARLLGDTGLRSAVVHSRLPLPDRRGVLSRFARGELDVVSAPRVLDEGIDVPAADLAVIAGASSSRRQMVQRMGRVLRRKADGRRARFAVLFVEGTVEDPAAGAHEGFLDEVSDVADELRRLPSTLLADRPGLLRQALRPSWGPPAGGPVDGW